MTGLILKDLMCLRKQIKTTVGVFISIFIMVIMIALSAKYGNIRIWVMEGMANQSYDDQIVLQVMRSCIAMVFMIFLLIPLALAAENGMVCAADHKAGFEKISAILPIPLSKRVLGRYLSYGIILSGSIALDIVLAFVLSCCTELIDFGEAVGITFTMAGVMGIFGSLSLFYLHLFGFNKVQTAGFAAYTTLAAGFILPNWNSVKKLFAFSEILENGGQGNPDFLIKITDAMKYKSFIVMLIFAVVFVASYFGALAIASRKRGMI